MNFPELNWLAIVVAVILNMALGFLWYSPVLFGKKWQKLLAMKDSEMKGASSMTWMVMVGGEIIATLIIAVVLKWLGTVRLVDAVKYGLMFGALHFFPNLTNAYFAGMGKKDKVQLAWIDGGYIVVSYVLIALLLVWWK